MSTLIFPSNIQQDHTLLTPTSQGLLFPGELKVETSHTVISPIMPSYINDYLKVGNALSELNTADLKTKARENLGINDNIEWGNIEGVLEDQEDLINYINNKIDDLEVDEMLNSIEKSLENKVSKEELNEVLDNIKLDNAFVDSIGNRVFTFNGFNSEQINIGTDVIEVSSEDVLYHTKFKNFFAIKTPVTHPFEGFVLGSGHSAYIINTTSGGPSYENLPFIYSDIYGFVRTDGSTLYLNVQVSSEYKYVYGGDNTKYYKYNNTHYNWDSRGTSLIVVKDPTKYTYNFKLSNLIDYTSYLYNSNIEQYFININDGETYIFDSGELILKPNTIIDIADGSVTKQKLETSVQNSLNEIPTLQNQISNISTINGQSLLNGGNITIEAGMDEETLYEFTTLKNKMDILYKVALSLSGGKNVEQGTTQTVTLNWTVKVNGSNVNPGSQTISNGTTTETLGTTVRSKTYTGVTSNTTYTLTVDGVTANANVKFYYPAYFGVVSSDYTPNNSVSGLTKLTNYGSKSHNATTSTAGFNKVVYMYPSSLGALTTIKDGNNFELLSSFTRSTVTINNVNYYAYVLTSATNTASQTFKFT